MRVQKYVLHPTPVLSHWRSSSKRVCPRISPSAHCLTFWSTMTSTMMNTWRRMSFTQLLVSTNDALLGIFLWRKKEKSFCVFWKTEDGRIKATACGVERFASMLAEEKKKHWSDETEMIFSSAENKHSFYSKTCFQRCCSHYLCA